jgi:Ca2+-dependent lipid-binding protein
VPKQERPAVKAAAENGANGNGVSNGNGNGHQKTDSTASVPAPPPPPQVIGVEMSKEELVKQQSGVIVFNVIGGRLAKKARLEVLMDDGYWPVFSTVKARSTTADWEHVGEGFVRELDFGRVWLRLNESSESEKDNILGEWKGDAKQFLLDTMSGPKKYTLVDADDRNSSTIEIESRYVPVPVKLEARESINNQGTLRIDLLDGREIHGVDRGGKSDPYAVFTLNGQKVFKSQTKKKTLTPEWNENFTCQVPSRVGAQFSVEIFDWNQIEQAKSLGTCNIELNDLEPFQSTERSLYLSHQKHGDKGEIRIRLLFTPEIIAKARKNTSTFSTAGRAMTNIGHIPANAGKGVLGVFKREKDYAKNGKDDDAQSIPELPAGQASLPARMSESITSVGRTSVDANGSSLASSIAPGALKVTVISAKDLSTSDVKPYVTARLGDREHKTKHSKSANPEWNETFVFSASQLTPKLYIWIHDHKTLGKDKQLGEAEIDIWRHVNPGSVPAADVTAELREGQGIVRLRLEYDSDGSSSLSSLERQHTHSPSRFSLRPRKSHEFARD